jgi:hypothetical protein
LDRRGCEVAYQCVAAHLEERRLEAGEVGA